MKKTIISAAVVATFLVGCGGSSGGDGSGEPSTQTGLFIDAAVQGLDYATATENGVTDINGQFLYKNGEEITFSIGYLALPATTASEIITPLELAGTDNIQDPQVLNMVRLLMTLDTDGDPDNGISISQQAKDNAIPVEFDVPTTEFEANQDVLSLITSAGQDAAVTSLVSTDEATEHFQNSLDEIEAIDTYADFVGMYNFEANDPDPDYTTLFNIYPDGSYLLIEFYPDDLIYDTGFEYGDLGLVDDTLNPVAEVDTNPYIESGITGNVLPVYMQGETLFLSKIDSECENNLDSCDEMNTPRIQISGNSIVGSWETQDGSASYNFRDDGRYFFAQIKDPNAVTGSGDIGMEVGDYQFDATSQTLTLDIIPDSDTSGASLLANEGVSYDINSAVLSEDGQTLTLKVDYNNATDTELKLTRKL